MAAFSGTYSEDGPRFSLDGKRLYYYSKRPDKLLGKQKKYGDIWYVTRTERGLGNPVNIGYPVNTDMLE